MLRWLLCFALAVSAAAVAFARETDRYARVEVAPTKTSIYVGTVAMTMPTFVRHGDRYEAPYTATVFPFFFYDEQGTLDVDVSAAQLEELARGHPITCTGQALRTDGVKHRVEVNATPTGTDGGTLKVRVIYSKHIELVFHTTYRFEPAAGP